MLDHSIGALPVTRGGRLVGIITETDIMRAFVWLAGGAAAPGATRRPGTAASPPGQLP
jgi:CBS domain-containing protein